MEKKDQQPRNDNNNSNAPKKAKNAGSAGFNQGAEQEENLNDGVADGTPQPDKVSKEKENPKSGKVG